MSDLRVHSVHVAAAGDGRAVTQSVTRGDGEDVQAFTTRVLAMLAGSGLPFAVDATDLVEPQPSAPVAIAPSSPPVPVALAPRRNKQPKTEQARRILEHLLAGAAEDAIAAEIGCTPENVAAIRRRWCPELAQTSRRPHTATAAPGPTTALASATGNEPPASSPHPPAVTTPAAAVPRAPGGGDLPPGAARRAAILAAAEARRGVRP